MHAARRLLYDIHPLVFILVLLAGSPFILIGGTEVWQAWQQLHNYPTVPGTVIANDYRADDDSGGAYYPVVTFTPLDGPTVRFTDGIGSLPPDYAPGATVEVVYNPRHIQEARIKSWKRVWLVPTLLISVGSLPLVLYLGWRVSTRLRGTNIQERTISN